MFVYVVEVFTWMRSAAEDVCSVKTVKQHQINNLIWIQMAISARCRLKRGRLERKPLSPKVSGKTEMMIFRVSFLRFRCFSFLSGLLNRVWFQLLIWFLEDSSNVWVLQVSPTRPLCPRVSGYSRQQLWRRQLGSSRWRRFVNADHINDLTIFRQQSFLL